MYSVLSTQYGLPVTLYATPARQTIPRERHRSNRCCLASPLVEWNSRLYGPRMPAAKDNHSAIGIDLGTTLSVICNLDDLGRPQTLINGEGDKITPSAVFFEGENIVVGKEAVKALATDAEQVAE